MTLPIAHIFNGELGFDVRTKLNDLIDLAGGGSAPFTQGSVLFADSSGFTSQDNANFFWDDTGNILKIAAELQFQGAAARIRVAGTVRVDYDIYSAGFWSFNGNLGLLPGFGYKAMPKAGAPANTDLPAGTFLVIDDTSASQTWLTYNNAGTIKKTEIGAAPGGGGMAIGSPVTSGTSGSILYVDSGTNLAQQNANLFFDDPNNALKIGTGHTYNIGTFRALYQVPNVSGDNWFEGDAGNSSVTGYKNFGTGAQCLFSLTTGFGNTGVGTSAMQNVTTGSSNFAFGTSALAGATSGSNNTAIGPNVLQVGNLIGSNVGVGQNALQQLGNAGFGGGAENANVGIGGNAFNQMIVGTGNIAIGANAGLNVHDASGFTAIGYQAGANATGSNNQATLIGNFCGQQFTSINNSTIIGSWAGVSASVNGIIALHDGAAPFATNPKADCGFSNAGWTFVGSPKAGAPANTDLPSGYFSVIDDTSAGQTWLVFNKAGTIRKVQLV